MPPRPAPKFLRGNVGEDRDANGKYHLGKRRGETDVENLFDRLPVEYEIRKMESNVSLSIHERADGEYDKDKLGNERRVRRAGNSERWDPPAGGPPSENQERIKHYVHKR